MTIDDLVVTLNLDTSKFNQDQKDALAKVKQFQEETSRRAKDIGKSGTDVMDSLTSVGKRTLSVFGVVAGVDGLINVAKQSVNAGSAVGQLSRNIGVSAEVISKWQGAARIYGGTAEGMAGSFKTLSDTIGGLKLGMVSQLTSDLRSLGALGGTAIDPSMPVNDMLIAIGKNLKTIYDERGADVAGALQTKLGLDPALFALFIEKGEKAADVLRDINGLTQANADQALLLKRRWDDMIVSSENKGLRLFFGAVDLAKKLWVTPGVDEKPDKFTGASRVGGTTGAFKSANEKEAFIRQEAVRRGQNPDTWVTLAKNEGFYNYTGDQDATGVPTSFGSFQLHYPGVGRNTADGLGTRFTRETGLNARDPDTERQQITWSMDYAAMHGLSDWHGWHGSQFANNPSGGPMSTNTTTIGSVNVYAAKGDDAPALADKFRTAILARNASVAQASGGPQ